MNLQMKVLNNVPILLIGPGVGVQFHFSDKMSFYVATKLKVGSTVRTRSRVNFFALDAEFPIGLSFRF